MDKYIIWFEIAAFLSSLAAWPSIKNQKHLRIFPILLFIVVAVEVYETFLPYRYRSFNSRVYNIQVPLQYVLYLLILYFSLKRRVYKKIALAGIVILIPLSVISELYLTPPDHFNVLSYSTGSLLLIILIVARFYEMLQNPVGFNFMKNPCFYILFAFLLFNVGTLPYFTMGNWLFYVKGYKGVVHMLVNVMSILNYILYTTYTIAFIWIIRKKDCY